MNTEKIKIDCFYHIYNRGNNKENLFIEEKNYEYFLNLVSKHLSPISEIYSYCLLKNHFHILLKIKKEKELSDKYINNLHKPFSNLFNAYTKAINKVYDRTGSLFQKPFQKIEIQDDDYLKQVIAYIHLNPLKHKFTNDFENYKYSSYQKIILNNNEFIESKKVIDLFDDVENFQYCHNENKIRYESVIEEINKLDNY